MSTLNRRSFLAAGISTGVALAAPTLSHAATPTPKPDTDILIVGGGFAGLTAAVMAARAGASVRIIDKRTWLGGDGILSSGILYAARTPYHDKADIKEGLTKDDFWKYWTTSNATSFDGSHTKSNPKVMRATCDLSADVIAFIASYGIQFNRSVRPSPSSSPPSPAPCRNSPRACSTNSRPRESSPSSA